MVLLEFEEDVKLCCILNVTIVVTNSRLFA